MRNIVQMIWYTGHFVYNSIISSWGGIAVMYCFYLWSSMMFLLFSLHLCIIIRMYGTLFTTIVVDTVFLVDINLYLLLLHDTHLMSCTPSLLFSFHFLITHVLLFISLNIILIFCVLLVHLMWHPPPPTYPTNGLRWYHLFIMTLLYLTPMMMVVGI